MTLSCNNISAVHTVGHSTRTSDIFIGLLKEHGVEIVVDVRRWPTSQRYPHFKREAIAASLRKEAVEYIWRGDLGGFRKASPDSPNTGWNVGAFRAYADFMLTSEFDGIMTDMESLAGEKRMAVMCAEAVPWRCHRQLLADAFTVRAWAVRHILENGCHEHHLPPFARPEGRRILYPET